MLPFQKHLFESTTLLRSSFWSVCHGVYLSSVQIWSRICSLTIDSFIALSNKFLVLMAKAESWKTSGLDLENVLRIRFT